MKTMDFFAWLKINYPDHDADDFLCENCAGDITYDCLSCGQSTTCKDCSNGVSLRLFDDELEEIYDEYKAQRARDKKFLEAI